MRYELQVKQVAPAGGDTPTRGVNPAMGVRRGAVDMDEGRQWAGDLLTEGDVSDPGEAYAQFGGDGEVEAWLDKNDDGTLTGWVREGDQVWRYSDADAWALDVDGAQMQRTDAGAAAAPEVDPMAADEDPLADEEPAVGDDLAAEEDPLEGEEPATEDPLADEGGDFENPFALPDDDETGEDDLDGDDPEADAAPEDDEAPADDEDPDADDEEDDAAVDPDAEELPLDTGDDETDDDPDAESEPDADDEDPDAPSDDDEDDEDETEEDRLFKRGQKKYHPVAATAPRTASGAVIVASWR